MRAVRYDRYGPPDVLDVVEVDEPPVGDDDVLVEVAGASVNGGEMMIRRGVMRRIVRGALPRGVGNDLAGRVLAVGPAVRSPAVGDQVWGLMPHGTFGSVAERVSVPSSLVARTPQGLDGLDAAALPSSGTTAARALLDEVQLGAGQRLLVRGAAGGVGSIAVQLGRHLGAHVTALASQRDLEWLRELGATEALDYRTTRLAELEAFDVILDLVGTDLRALERRLTRSGRLLPLAVDPEHLLRSFAFAARALLPGGRIRAFSNAPDRAQLERLTELVEAGAIRPLVAGVLPMERAAEAHERMEAGGIRGKLVLDVGSAGAG